MISLIHPSQKRVPIPLKFEVVFNYDTFFKVAQSYPHGPKLAPLTVSITIWDVKRKSPDSGCYISPKSLIRSRDLSGAVSAFEGSTSRRSTSSFHAVDVPVADLFCHDFVFNWFYWASRRGCRSFGDSSTFSPFLHCSVFLTWYAFLFCWTLYFNSENFAVSS